MTLIHVEIDEKVWNLVTKWCKWSGDHPLSFLEWAVLYALEVCVDSLREDEPDLKDLMAEIEKTRFDSSLNHSFNMDHHKTKK